MRAGPYELTFLDMGNLRLDGGAIFGIVPRPVWEKQFAPDEANRIALACRGLLLRGAGRVIVVDTGAGTRWSERDRRRFGLGSRDVRDAVEAEGVRPAEVTDVLLTHLHFDHAGGAVDESGRPAFQNAVYHVQRRALDWARQPTERDRGSFRSEDFEPLAAAGRLRAVEGDALELPGIRAILSEGHTTALQVPVIGDSVVFPADLVPTTAHLRTAWIMAYDLRPIQVVEEKRAILSEAAAKGWTVVFEHDPRRAATKVREAEGGFEAVAPVTA